MMKGFGDVLDFLDPNQYRFTYLYNPELSTKSGDNSGLTAMVSVFRFAQPPFPERGGAKQELF
jgi:hypothetical protein